MFVLSHYKNCHLKNKTFIFVELFKPNTIIMLAQNAKGYQLSLICLKLSNCYNMFWWKNNVIIFLYLFSVVYFQAKLCKLKNNETISFLSIFACSLFCKAVIIDIVRLVYYIWVDHSQRGSERADSCPAEK